MQSSIADSVSPPSQSLLVQQNASIIAENMAAERNARREKLNSIMTRVRGTSAAPAVPGGNPTPPSTTNSTETLATLSKTTGVAIVTYTTIAPVTTTTIIAATSQNAVVDVKPSIFHEVFDFIKFFLSRS